MILRLLGNALELFLPSHPDVALASSVTDEALLSMVRLSFFEKEKVYTALPYAHEHVRAIVRANKYYNDEVSARKMAVVFADLITAISEERALEMGGVKPLLVPAPSSPRRARERRRHQIKAVARHLPTQVFEVCTYADVLVRSERLSQTRVTMQKRHENIAGAFFVPPTKRENVVGKSILVIDDVSESGATMADMMRALSSAGARDVVGLALAR